MTVRTSATILLALALVIYLGGATPVLSAQEAVKMSKAQQAQLRQIDQAAQNNQGGRWITQAGQLAEQYDAQPVLKALYAQCLLQGAQLAEARRVQKAFVMQAGLAGPGQTGLDTLLVIDQRLLDAADEGQRKEHLHAMLTTLQTIEFAGTFKPIHLELKADILMQLERAQEATVLWQQQLAASPRRGFLWLQLGHAQLRQGQDQDARVSLEMAWILLSDSDRKGQAAAMLLLMAKDRSDWPQALKWADAAGADKWTRAQLHFKARQLDKALAIAEQVVAGHGDVQIRRQATRLVVHIMLDQEATDEQLQVRLEEAIKTMRDGGEDPAGVDPFLWYQLASVTMRQGLTQQAAAAALMAAQSMPEDHDLQRFAIDLQLETANRQGARTLLVGYLARFGVDAFTGMTVPRVLASSVRSTVP